jgi:2-polyprenyl-3-methyl-5-hydroxy-6-metoxy-1,4-benzoquinol methylase
VTTGARTFYDRYWRNEHIKRNPFDEHPGQWTDAGYIHHMDLFRPFMKGRVLDFGCGDGQFVQRARLDGMDVCGADVSQEAIRRAKSLFPAIDVREMDDTIPFASDTFDTITCMDVLEHILDVEGTLEEMHRVLKPGGCLLLTTTEMTRVKLLAVLCLRFHDYFYPTSPHIRYFTRRNLAEVLARKGFIVEAYAPNYLHLGLVPMGQFVAARKERDKAKT